MGGVGPVAHLQCRRSEAIALEYVSGGQRCRSKPRHLLSAPGGHLVGLGPVALHGDSTLWVLIRGLSSISLAVARGDLSFHNFLYPAPADARRLLSFFVERLPKRGTGGAGGEEAAKGRVRRRFGLPIRQGPGGNGCSARRPPRPPGAP